MPFIKVSFIFIAFGLYMLQNVFEGLFKKYSLLHFHVYAKVNDPCSVPSTD